MAKVRKSSPEPKGINKTTELQLALRHCWKIINYCILLRKPSTPKLCDKTCEQPKAHDDLFCTTWRFHFAASRPSTSSAMSKADWAVVLKQTWHVHACPEISNLASRSTQQWKIPQGDVRCNGVMLCQASRSFRMLLFSKKLALTLTCSELSIKPHISHPNISQHIIRKPHI